MAKGSDVKGFPDISNKLGAPSKKSLFERQKAEADAKRQREQQETAAVYEEFVKSFDDDGENAPRAPPPARGAFSGGGPSKRHFTGPGLRGGPGGQRSGPGSLGPAPPTLNKKRPSETNEPTRREGLFAFEDDSPGPADPRKALQNSDDEDVQEQQRSEDRAVPKPTLRLSSLPPGISPAAIKAVIPPNLSIEGVRILPPAGPGTNATERRSVTAIVTLAQDTPALDIDTAVSALQNRYMGRGYYLTLSRHLSSTAFAFDTPKNSLNAAISALPFGARPIQIASLGRGRGSSVHRGGFAPPTSFAPPSQLGRGAPQVQVTVTPPSDLKQLKLIHKTVEALLRHGPEFEALLMTRKEIQLEQKWAWLWDSRSVGGVYYRWRIWDIFSEAYRRKHRVPANTPTRIFENGAAWIGPDLKLPFEYTTRLEEIVSDSDYHSSEDEDSGDEGRRRYAQHHGGAPPPDGPVVETESQSYLNPLPKAKLTHLLARLPESNAKLRRGDVARVTAFAIQHAGEGADEVVQMIVSNVATPFNCSSANPDYKNNKDHSSGSDSDADNTDAPPKTDNPDTSPSKLVALYIISDILSSSSTSGVRHAWRYRSQFESQLKAQQTFPHLGRLSSTLNWGKLRQEKWKRSVNSILTLWEGWCVFPAETQEEFKRVFEEPPLSQEEIRQREEEEEARKAEQARRRFKTMQEKEEEAEEAAAATAAAEEQGDAMDVDADEDSDLESVPGTPFAMHEYRETGRPFPRDKGFSGRPLVPKTSGVDKRAALAASIAAKMGKPPQASVAPPDGTAGAGAVRKRQRPKAEDMFASDEE